MGRDRGEKWLLNFYLPLFQKTCPYTVTAAVRQASTKPLQASIIYKCRADILRNYPSKTHMICIGSFFIVGMVGRGTRDMMVLKAVAVGALMPSGVDVWPMLQPLESAVIPKHTSPSAQRAPEMKTVICICVHTNSVSMAATRN